MAHLPEDDLYYTWLPQVGELSNISLPGIVLPFTSYNGYLVFSIICHFTESTTVIEAIVGFLVNPLNNKRNQGACISCEIFLAWLSAGNVSKSCPRAIIVTLTKALGHMQKYRLWSILGLYLWRNVIAGLEEVLWWCKMHVLYGWLLIWAECQEFWCRKSHSVFSPC